MKNGSKNKSQKKSHGENGHKNEEMNHDSHDNTLSQISIDTSIELTEGEIESLIFMYQEEKLAMDVYDTFAEQYDSKIFDKISDAEEQHLTSIENILTSYEINIDELDALDDGEFINEDLQSLYNTLIEQGSNSLEDALNVGVIIEEADIADLNLYLQDDVNINIETAYNNLESGSQNHLSAFNNQLDNDLFL